MSAIEVKHVLSFFQNNSKTALLPHLGVWWNKNKVLNASVVFRKPSLLSKVSTEKRKAFFVKQFPFTAVVSR